MRSDLLEEMVPALDLACRKAGKDYGQALSVAILTRWLTRPEKPTTAATPSNPPNPPDAATDKQCNELLQQATRYIVSAAFGQHMGAEWGGNRAKARENYRRALEIYRRGATFCKHGRFPAVFAERIRQTTRSLRAVGGQP
jgi:hypothetical protein